MKNYHPCLLELFPKTMYAYGGNVGVGNLLPTLKVKG